MTTFMTLLKSLPVILKFWGEFKELFVKIGEMKHQWEVKKFLKNLTKASEDADETGDSSGYEDIIRNG